MPQPTSTSSHAGEFTRRPIKESRTVALKAAGLLTRISGAALCGCSTPLCDRSPRGIALGCGSFRLAAAVTSDRAAWSSSTRLRYRRACTASLVSFPAELHAHPAWRPPAACSRRHRRAVARRDLTLVAHRPAILEALSALRSLDRGQQPHQDPSSTSVVPRIQRLNGRVWSSSCGSPDPCASPREARSSYTQLRRSRNP